MLWPEDEEITVVKFNHPKWGRMPKANGAQAATLRLGTGRVLHNIDTVGMDVDPALLGLHLDLHREVAAGGLDAEWVGNHRRWRQYQVAEAEFTLRMDRQRILPARP